MKDFERELLSLFDYNPDTGAITWRRRARKNSSVKVGAPAGYLRPDGYRRVGFRFNGKRFRFYAHIVAWFMHYGEWPLKEMDHINGDRDDNRVCNLRQVTHRENLMNRVINRAGRLPGCCLEKRSGKWRARIQFDDKRRHIGLFDTEREANAAYMAALEQGGKT